MSVRLTFNRLQGAKSHPRPCCHLSFPIFHLLVFYSPRPIALKAVSNTIFFLFHQRKKIILHRLNFFPHPQYLYIFLFIFFLSLFDSACTGRSLPRGGVVEILEQKTCCQVGISTARTFFAFSSFNSLHVTVNLCLYFGGENTLVFVAKSDCPRDICDSQCGEWSR